MNVSAWWGNRRVKYIVRNRTRVRHIALVRYPFPDWRAPVNPTLTDAASGTIFDATAKHAATDVPVLDVIAERWSPRAFRDDHVLPDDALRSAFEAARWAPSAGNTQPWRFIMSRRGGENFARIVECLRPGNQTWAPSVSALIVNVAVTADESGREFPWAEYDLGQAVAYFTLQAHSEGLHVHQMGGFDRDAIRTAFSLDERHLPVSITAVGIRDDATVLPEDLRAREQAPRTRHGADDLILTRDRASN